MQILTDTEQSNAKSYMLQLMEEVFYKCRSLTGEGAYDTLKMIQREIGIQINEIESGKKVFDWTIPEEWNIKDAYVLNSNGEKVIDFKENNLHILNYSSPINEVVKFGDLKNHLYTLPNHPNWIPYKTSYYQKNWGFCLSQNQYDSIFTDDEEEFHVVIDTTLENGVLRYGELYIPGKVDQEILISTYFCHPSMGNDNLSGVVLATFLGKLLKEKQNFYSYRIIFVPETIGAVTWLYENRDSVNNIKHGFVLTCVGDKGDLTLKKTRSGNAEVDKVVEYVLSDSGNEYNIIDFFPGGSDERQFSSPGFDLPVCSLMRSMYWTFPEYHTSADNLEFMEEGKIGETAEYYLRVFHILENNKFYRNLKPYGEPQLGKRGLYRMIGANKDQSVEEFFNEMAMLWILNYSDNKHTLLDISLKSEIPFNQLLAAANALIEKGLIIET